MRETLGGLHPSLAIQLESVWRPWPTVIYRNCRYCITFRDERWWKSNNRNALGDSIVLGHWQCGMKLYHAILQWGVYGSKCHSTSFARNLSEGHTWLSVAIPLWQFGEVWACLDASSSEATLMQLAATCCNYILAKPKLEQWSFQDN